MTNYVSNATTVLRLMPRTFALLLMLAAPVLALPSMMPDSGSTIEAPALKKNGMGFVLLISLQRG